jgi:hypothetical protein
VELRSAWDTGEKRGKKEEPELSCPFGVMVERGCHRGGAGFLKI